MAACLADPPDEEIRRSVKTWLIRVLLPARVPGLQVPEVDDLKEVETMLADRVLEWTREWKEEGRQEGLLEGSRELLLSQMEERFGSVPEEARRQVEALQDLDELKKLARRIVSASTLDDLGLA